MAPHPHVLQLSTRDSIDSGLRMGNTGSSRSDHRLFHNPDVTAVGPQRCRLHAATHLTTTTSSTEIQQAPANACPVPHQQDRLERIHRSPRPAIRRGREAGRANQCTGPASHAMQHSAKCPHGMDRTRSQRTWKPSGQPCTVVSRAHSDHQTDPTSPQTNARMHGPHASPTTISRVLLRSKLRHAD